MKAFKSLYGLPKIIILALLSALPIGNSGLAAADMQSTTAEITASSDRVQAAVDLEVFVREGCPHCVKAEEFLSALSAERPDVRISMRDVSRDALALERLKQLSTAQGLNKLSVPAFYINGQLIIGFSEDANTGNQIRAELDRAKHAKQAPVATPESCIVDKNQTCESETPSPSGPEKFEVALFGHTLSLEQVGLPMFTLAMGLLDGFNPCSMWVLILMISLLAPMQNRWRMLAVAGTFIAVEGVAYLVFMAAWLNLFLLVGLSRASEIIIAALAILAGAIHIKDFPAYGRGISLSIPQKSKPGIYVQMRHILQAENLLGAMIGAVILAILVQIVEFLCTSGFPALYTRILTLQQLSGFSYYGYLLLYNAAYMLDDVIVLGIGVFTLSQRRLQENEGRWLKLISGAVMVGLGVYLLAIRHPG
ncbi:glutaredoxin [Methylomicrobium sp. Wu6]|uniref:glutaredoxin family protein n=1 Tax=Methylomicrobium sp. Wu6 TaxID=3107928 RepID=UPI002DD686D3|nr:glutaredoxin [Methylomicrobium sp. Wu6]MEC4749284.1 glutaredoxin [Methylomicrobium sp. Wu6]